MLNPSRIAAALIAIALVSCGGDDDGENGDNGGRQSTGEALFGAREMATEIERDIVSRAKKEDREVGNDPADYTYEARCAPQTETRLTCRLDLTDSRDRTVNTVAYRANIDRDTGDFGYKVTANRDTREPRGGQP